MKRFLRPRFLSAIYFSTVLYNSGEKATGVFKQFVSIHDFAALYGIYNLAALGACDRWKSDPIGRRREPSSAQCPANKITTVYVFEEPITPQISSDSFGEEKQWLG